MRGNEKRMFLPLEENKKHWGAMGAHIVEQATHATRLHVAPSISPLS